MQRRNSSDSRWAQSPFDSHPAPAFRDVKNSRPDFGRLAFNFVANKMRFGLYRTIWSNSGDVLLSELASPP
jgi:hypothetical protein